MHQEMRWIHGGLKMKDPHKRWNEEENILCERCGDMVEFLTKTTNSCTRCAKEELDMGQWTQDEESDIETAGELAKTNKILELTLQEEGV